MFLTSMSQTRRVFLFGTAAIVLGAAIRPADAQKVTPEATKRKITLANDLYILNEMLLTEAGAIKIGFETEKSKALLAGAVDEVNRHIDLLLNGEPSSGMEKEHSVAVQFILSDIKDRWAVYGQHIEGISQAGEVTGEALKELIHDSHEFEDKVKELVNIIYDVYGKVIFSTEELRAVTLLAHERVHIEEMQEKMVFAAAFPEEKDAYMAELIQLGDVFVQTVDVLIRNGAMFGVAPPPSPEALAALELVEEHWAPKGEIIKAIAANGNITNEEIGEFFAVSESVAEELDAAIEAYNDALPRS